jgi:uncharacterized membrane protein
MIRVEESVTIERPIEEVFTYLSDIERQSDWASAVSESTKLSSGPTGLGTTYRQVGKLLGRRLELNCEITAYEPPRLYEFQLLNGPLRGRMRFTLVSEGQGTRVTQVLEGESGGFFKLADPILTRTVQKQLGADLEALKGLVESGIAMQTSSSADY